MQGFGFNFYGYFVFAAIWICAYALWVRFMNANERAKENNPSNHRTGDTNGK
jgi:hypothetical protein